VAFRVRLPEDTPPNEPVYVMVLPFTDWYWSEDQHVPLEPAGDGWWTATASLEEGALVRYVYDRWDETEWSAFKDTREAHGEAVQIESRYLLVTEDLTQVEDVVETWNDRRAPAQTGTLTGVVTDVETGQPLMDVDLSIGGINIASDYDGGFRLEGVAAGPQRVVAYHTTGEYAPAQVMGEVAAGETTALEVRMRRAKPVQVTFEVALPPDTPEWAEVKVVGSVRQAGARLAGFPNYPVMAADLDLPALERVAPDRAVGVLTLHEGTYLQYYYSIGSSAHGAERTQDGAQVFRSLAVPSSADALVRHERVASWRPGGNARVTLHVTTPPSTDPRLPLMLAAGPHHTMTQTGPHSWAFVLHGFPDQDFRFHYLLGGDGVGMEGTPGLGENSERIVTFDTMDTVVEHRIERWLWDRPAVPLAQGQTADVTFRVAVPSSTPPDADVRLVGDAPALAGGVPMMPVSGGARVYEATVRLPTTEALVYRYERGAEGVRSTGDYTMTVQFTEHTVNDWVTRWSDEPESAVGARPDFMAGIYTPDFWSQHFLGLSSTTYERIREHAGGWVAVSSVWSYEQIQPLPRVGSRCVAAGSVLTPREDILAQAAIAHEAGLKVLLAPQFNMEMSPGGLAALGGQHSAAWWDAWLEQAERMWLWNAHVAQEAGAEALMLPGFVFHVWSPDWGYPSPEYMAEFDVKVADLIGRVREVYDGKLLVSGGTRDNDFPGLADLIGVTTYDTGHPELPWDATVEQWREGYDALFVQTVDPRWERWGVPVLFYTLHLPVMADAPDFTAQEEAKARRLEGFFQALESRPWVTGTFSWAYMMIDAPLHLDDGVRATLAEAVLAKHYARLTGG
jgi:hypothetical protein